MTEAANTLLIKLQTSDIMDTQIRGLIGWPTTPKHVIKFTKGPVPEIFHTCKKKILFYNLNTDI
jgi:hypothetical protein